MCGEAASHWDRRKDEAYVNEFSAKGRRVLYAAPPRGLSRRMNEYESTAWQTYRPRPGLAGSVAGHLSCNGCLLRGSSERTQRNQEFFRNYGDTWGHLSGYHRTKLITDDRLGQLRKRCQQGFTFSLQCSVELVMGRNVQSERQPSERSYYSVRRFTSTLVLHGYSVRRRRRYIYIRLVTFKGEVGVRQ